jgi:urease accessory protein
MQAASKTHPSVYLGLSLFFLSFGATPAGAHTGLGDAHTFTAGVLHPFAGLDHLLAAFAVGLWATLSGARRPLLLPVAFVATMAAAALVGASGVRLPYVEPALAATVVALGLLIALTVQTSTAVGAALVAAFAAVHGYAHGAEGGAAAPYLAGLIVATALLHLAGIAAGLAFRAVDRPLLVRTAGAAVVVLGAYVLVA